MPRRLGSFAQNPGMAAGLHSTLAGAPGTRAARDPARTWRVALAGVLAGAGAVGVLYADGFASLVAVWSSTVAYRFLFFVPALAAWFLWRRWPEVRGLQPSPSPAGLAYALPFAGLWLFAQATQLAIGAQVAAVGMLQAVFLTVLGWPVCRRLLFPLLLLWLMVPVGDLLVPALIETTTGLTIAGLRLAGLPAVADGNLLVAGGARYSIIQECSGLDFLLGNFLVSLVFANLIYRGTRRKAIYVLSSLAVAVLANNLRTTSVILVTAGGIDLAANHEAYGWFVFLLAMLGQMAVGARFRDAPEAPATLPEGGPVQVPAGGLPLVTAAVGIIVLAALAPAYARVALVPEAGPVPVLLCPPPPLASLRAPPAGAEAWRPVFPAAGGRVHGVLAVAGRPVDVFIAYYWRQGPASKLIAGQNRLHDGVHWRYMTSGTAVADVAGTPFRVATERLAGPAGQRRLVWYGYWVDGQFTSRPWMAKLLQARSLRPRGERRAALIALATEESGPPGEAGSAARDTLEAALELQPVIAVMLDDAARGDAPGRTCS